MRDEIIHFECFSHIIVDKTREPSSAFDAAKSASFPHPTGDKLESCAVACQLKEKDTKD